MSSNEHRGAVFIGSDVYRRAAYGSNHPLTIPRVGPVTDLCCHMGWLNDENYIEAVDETRRGKELWYFFIIASLVLMIFESFYSRTKSR